MECLRYALELGTKEKRIMEECYRRRRPLPERIKNAPELLVGLEHFYDCYLELSTARSVGWDALPINVNQIYEYAHNLDFDEDEAAELVFFIMRMDAEFLKIMEEKKARESKK